MKPIDIHWEMKKQIFQYAQYCMNPCFSDKPSIRNKEFVSSQWIEKIFGMYISIIKYLNGVLILIPLQFNMFRLQHFPTNPCERISVSKYFIVYFVFRLFHSSFSILQLHKLSPLHLENDLNWSNNDWLIWNSSYSLFF